MAAYNKAMQPAGYGFFSTSRGSAAADLNSYVDWTR